MSCNTTCAAVVILQSVCFELAEHKQFTSDVNQSFNRSIGGHNLSNYILMLGQLCFVTFATLYLISKQFIRPKCYYWNQELPTTTTTRAYKTNDRTIDRRKKKSPSTTLESWRISGNDIKGPEYQEQPIKTRTTSHEAIGPRSIFSAVYGPLHPIRYEATHIALILRKCCPNLHNAIDSRANYGVL